MKKVFALMAVVAIVGCSKTNSNDESIDNTYKPIDMTSASYKGLSSSTADFAFNLFHAVNSEIGENGENVIISPMSAAFALGMTANGATDATLDELLSVLGADEIGIDGMNDYFHTLVTELPKLDKTATLKIANSLWTKPSFTLLPTFTSALTGYFDAETNELDVSTAVSDINSWCSRNTDGLISNFYSDGDITEDTEQILLNALYFDGKWVYKFDKDNTQAGTFTNYDGSEATVSYMHNEINSRYYAGDNYSVITLYFGNSAYYMQIVLPDEGVTVSECAESISREDWAHWAAADWAELDVKLPKFSVNYKKSLKSSLESMGLETTFGSGEFYNMSESNTRIDDIKQETVFSIDENGAEAAAVTGEEYATSPGWTETGEFHVTRPFIYLVTEKSSETILFIGRVTKL